MQIRRGRVLAVATLALLIGQAPAAELLRRGAEPLDAGLLSIGRAAATFGVGGEQNPIAWDDLVRWGSPTDPQPRPVVVLRDRSEIVAAPPWTRDGSIRLAGGGFAIRSSALRLITAPRGAVHSLLFEAAKDPELRRVFARASAERQAEDDELHLVNGDRLSGELVALGGGEASLLVAGERVDLELSRVAAVRLGPPSDRPLSEGAQGAILVGLSDGALLRAASATDDGDGFAATLLSGVRARGRKRGAIVFLQPLGRGVVYLSDLAPLQYRHTPYAGVAWPLGRDAGLRGEPLRAGGRRFLKGLAMHSPSRVVYRLTPGEHTRLEFAMAIDDSAALVGGGAGQGGSVVFRVLAARGSGFEPAFASEVVRSGDMPRPASVDIAGARAIALVVEPADFGDRLDHALWLDARLLNEAISDKR